MNDVPTNVIFLEDYRQAEPDLDLFECLEELYIYQLARIMILDEDRYSFELI